MNENQKTYKNKVLMSIPRDSSLASAKILQIKAFGQAFSEKLAGVGQVPKVFI